MAFKRICVQYKAKKTYVHTKRCLKPKTLVSLSKPQIFQSDKTLEWTVPLHIKSPNVSLHPYAQSKLNRRICGTLLAYLPKEMDLVTLPCEITFTRIAPRKLDSDNLAYAFKKIRDFCSDHLRPGLAHGRADCEKYFKFNYAQESAGKGIYGIKITFKNL